MEYKMNKISGQKTLDKLNDKYLAFIEANTNKPMSQEVMALVCLVEGYMLEANYYHDKFIDCLYIS
jgi:hypothetical protein